jgi:large subunit ribosomal protein L4
MTDTPVTSPLEVKSQHGTVTATVELDPAVFGVQPNVPVMHQVVTAQLAAARAGTQSTKTRAEVSGGGAKPYRQKGTGRARQGSTRAPHYAGGGVALGPKPRSYRQRTPRKMVQLALRCALSDRAAAGQVAVVDSWDWEVPSTKDAVAALSTLGLTGRVLLVLSRDDERAYKSFRNISGVDLVLVPELNAYDVLCSDWVVFTRATLPGDSTWGAAPAGGATTRATAEAADQAEPEARATGPASNRRRAATAEPAEPAEGEVSAGGSAKGEVSAGGSAEPEPLAADEALAADEPVATDEDATEEPVTEEQSDE